MVAMVAPMMQLMSSPEVRKKTGNVLKYLLGFGGAGIAIIAFIFFAMKWKKGGGLFGNLGKGIASAWDKTIGAAWKGSAKAIAGGWDKTVGAAWKGAWEKTGLFGGERKLPKADLSPEERKRLNLRMTRIKAGDLSALKGLPGGIGIRAGAVASALRKVTKKPSADTDKKIQHTIERKDELVMSEAEKKKKKKAEQKKKLDAYKRKWRR